MSTRNERSIPSVAEVRITDSGLVEEMTANLTLTATARLMGYTVQGIRELCERLKVSSEWVTIGVDRKTNQRVNARRLNPTVVVNEYGRASISGKLEFSSGPGAYQLTADSANRRQLRRDVAEAVVSRVRDQRPSVNRRYLKGEVVNSVQEGNADSGPEQAVHKIISPLAPRDPRGE